MKEFDGVGKVAKILLDEVRYEPLPTLYAYQKVLPVDINHILEPRAVFHPRFQSYLLTPLYQQRLLEL